MFPATCKILVVDDMKTMRMVMKKNLRECGFTNITEADDGATAWPLIEQASHSGSQFQLILSDWNMPVLAGIELLKKVRSHPALAKTPFLLVTAETEKTQIVEAIRAGVSNYVMKPFTAEILKKKLEDVHKKVG